VPLRHDWLGRRNRRVLVVFGRFSLTRDHFT
jgi:hypothetical protein